MPFQAFGTRAWCGLPGEGETRRGGINARLWVLLQGRALWSSLGARHGT